VVTDRETQRRSIKPVRIRPQRPRRFLQPRVSYDSNRERVLIRVTPEAPARMPPGPPVRVRAEFQEPLEPDAERRLEGELAAGAESVELYAEVASLARRTVTLQLHIDGYPRAFLYRVPCWLHVVDIPESRDPLEARIHALPDGDHYRPGDRIAVHLQVDAPENAFRNGEDVIEVGVDLDRDRELDEETVVALSGDRQVLVFAPRFGEGGTLAVRTEVRDWTLDLPPAGLANSAANVLARVIVGGRQAWSQPREVVFDELPPRVHRATLEPNRDVTQGEELVLTVWATDDELSGVASLEAGLDIDRSGEFAAEPKPVEAYRDPTTGRWSAKLNTGDYPPGQYALLLRVTDQLGNTTYTRFKEIRLLTAEQAAQQEAELRNRVAGNVLFGKRPVPGARLVLKPRLEPSDEGDTDSPKPQRIPPVLSDARGQFDFPEVPPGMYMLRAEVLLYNKIRSVAHAVRVPPPPKNVPHVQMYVP
jgi:hypothetical protein